MKKFLVLLSFFFVIVSCSKQPDTRVYHETEITSDVYVVNGLHLKTVVIDSCEYLIGSRQYGIYQGYGYLSHKGNCKYCAERRKRELQNVNKSHKSNGKMKNQLK